LRPTSVLNPDKREAGRHNEEGPEAGEGQARYCLRDLLAQWEDQLDLYIRESNGVIRLNKIIVPQSERGRGIGSQFTGDLTEYPDRTGQKIALDPSTDFGGSSLGRIKRFYRRFRFRNNTGRNRDFTISEAMVRDPRGTDLEIYEGKGAYSGYERTMDQVPTEGRESRFGQLRPTAVSEPGAGPLQGDLFLQPQESTARTPKQRREIAKRVRVVRVGSLNSGIERVQSPSDAAHVAAPLRKQAAEVFGYLVTDAEGCPVAFQQQSR